MQQQRVVCPDRRRGNGSWHSRSASDIALSVANFNPHWHHRVAIVRCQKGAIGTKNAKPSMAFRVRPSVDTHPSDRSVTECVLPRHVSNTEGSLPPSPSNAKTHPRIPLTNPRTVFQRLHAIRSVPQRHDHFSFLPHAQISLLAESAPAHCPHPLWANTNPQVGTIKGSRSIGPPSLETGRNLNLVARCSIFTTEDSDRTWWTGEPTWVKKPQAFNEQQDRRVMATTSLEWMNVTYDAEFASRHLIYRPTTLACSERSTRHSFLGSQSIRVTWM